jgi:hypothetical protein
MVLPSWPRLRHGWNNDSVVPLLQWMVVLSSVSVVRPAVRDGAAAGNQQGHSDPDERDCHVGRYVS